MHVIRTIQYAILTLASVTAVCWFAISGTAYLVFNKLLGFDQATTFGDQILADPVYPAILGIAAGLFLTMAIIRFGLTWRKMGGS